MARNKLLIPVVAALAIAACGAESGPGLETTTTSHPPTTSTSMPAVETTMPEVPHSNPDTAQETVIELAILDLVSRIGVSAESITVVAAENRFWPDGSLGCPQPGLSYTQALVEGSRVLLEADGHLYPYHAGSDGEPFLCESGATDGG